MAHETSLFLPWHYLLFSFEHEFRTNFILSGRESDANALEISPRSHVDNRGKTRGAGYSLKI
jgi:hypothetical protein